MSVKVQVGSDGSMSISDPSRPDVKERAAEAPVAQPVHREGGVVRKMQFDADGNVVSSSTSRPSGNQSATPASAVPTSRSAAGSPQALSQATPESIITIPGFGNSRADALETMGMIRKLPTGGYEVVPNSFSDAAAGEPNAAQQVEQPKVEVPEAIDPKDGANLPSTSAEADATLATLTARAPMALEGILTSLATGVDHSKLVADAAAVAKDEAFPAKFAAMHSEYISVGQQALRNVGLSNDQMQAFEDWSKNSPDEAQTALRDLVQHNSVGALQKLGRKFLSSNAGQVVHADEAVLSAEMGSGIKSYRGDNGEVLLSIPGHGTMRYIDALKNKIIKVTTKRPSDFSPR